MPEQSLGQGQTTNKAKTPLHIKTMLYLSDSEGTAFLFVTNCRIIRLYSRCGKTRPNTGSRRVKGKENEMFREIRRKNREIDSDSAKQLLQSSRRGVLAVNGDDGYPYAIPINYLYDDEAQRIYFHGAKIGHKVDALRACDKVCFTVYGNETIRTDAWAPFMQSVVVFGRCHLMEAGSEASQRLKQLAMKYYPSEQLVDEEIAQSGKVVQVFEIEIEHMSGKEVEER
jgi:nitroimidazol reductase NimA-like FMN-containing flavoprotein (pyridoxamine 5'-phosphate oxidase superfamily)